jgi:hypothetical protein
MTVAFLHERLASAALLFFLVAGIWGLIAYLRRRGVGSEYWGVLAIGEVLILVQAALGVLLWLEGERPARGIHILYGVVASITLPAFYAYSKGQDDRQAAFTYGLICLFLVGIVLRAATTAR